MSAWETGKIKTLHISDPSIGGKEAMDAWVELDSKPGVILGIELRPGIEHLPANLAQVSLLRDAFFHDYEVSIQRGEIQSGGKAAYVECVRLRRP